MGNSIIKWMPQPQPVLVWTLECSHVIICDCEHHYIGKLEYCSKCNAWKRLRIWSRYVGQAASNNQP